MSRLILALNHGESLPPAVKAEFEELYAALQAWANVSGDTVVPGNQEVTGFATILGQHCFRGFISSAFAGVPTGAETTIVWGTPMLQPEDYDTFRKGVEYDGAGRVYLKQPGLYLLMARVRWDSSALGTFRVTQFRIGNDDTNAWTDTPVAALTQMAVLPILVTKELLGLPSYSNGLPVTVEGAQDSGGTRTVESASWFSVAKIA